MKKYLVLLLSIAMVFSLAAVSMAEVKVSGDNTFTHDFNIDGTSSSKVDNNFYFKSQLNDKMDWTLRLGYSDKYDKDGKYLVPWIREAYSNIKAGEGSIRFGYWEVKPYSSIGILADNADSAIGRMKDLFTLAYYTPEFAPGLTAGLVYFIDGAGEKDNENRQVIDDNAFVGSLTYKGEKLFVDFYLVETNVDGDNMGYALNAKYQLLDPLTLGLNYGKRPGPNNEQAVIEIIEAQYEMGPIYVKGGYDLNDGDDALYPDHNRSACSIGYKMKNGITTEFRYKNLDAKADKQELRVMYKW